jgi:hypothetical protein
MGLLRKRKRPGLRARLGLKVRSWPRRSLVGRVHDVLLRRIGGDRSRWVERLLNSQNRPIGALQVTTALDKLWPRGSLALVFAGCD